MPQHIDFQPESTAIDFQPEKPVTKETPKSTTSKIQPAAGLMGRAAAKMPPEDQGEWVDFEPEGDWVDVAPPKAAQPAARKSVSLQSQPTTFMGRAQQSLGAVPGVRLNPRTGLPMKDIDPTGGGTLEALPMVGAMAGTALAGPEAGLWLRALLSTLGAGAGKAASQKVSGGNLDLKEAGRTGVEYGAVPEVAGAAAGKAVEAAGGLTKNLIARMMGVGSKDVMFGKDPARAILKYKLTGNNAAGLLDNVESKMDEVGKKIEQAVASPPRQQTPGIVKAGQSAAAQNTMDIRKSIADPINDAQKSVLNSTMTPEKKQEAIRELNGLSESLIYTHELDPQGNVVLGAVRSFAANLGKASPKEALDLKRLVGDNVNWQSSAFPGLMKSVQRRIYGNLRMDLEGAIPSIKELNQDYADLAGARQALRRTTSKETAGRGGIGLRDAAYAGAGELIGGGAGAAASLLAKRAAESTRGATTLARSTQSLAKTNPEVSLPAILRAFVALQRSGSHSNAQAQIGQSE